MCWKQFIRHVTTGCDKESWKTEFYFFTELDVIFGNLTRQKSLKRVLISEVMCSRQTQKFAESKSKEILSSNLKITNILELTIKTLGKKLVLENNDNKNIARIT